jgi:hypothetical protein
MDVDAGMTSPFDHAYTVPPTLPHQRDAVHSARAALGAGAPQPHPRPDRDPEQVGALITRLGEKQVKTITFRDGPDGRPVRSRFMFVRVRSAHHWRAHDDRGR